MRALLVFAVFLSASCGLDDESGRGPQEIVREIAKRELGEGSLAGFVVVVAKDGEFVVDEGFGVRDIVTKEPMTADAVLDYFSIGKHMTAAILLRLAEQGRINLDAPANAYLPGADFEGASVTTRQILSHSAGLSDPEIDWTNPPEFLIAAPTAGGMIEFANTSARIAAPGETWWYSNQGYAMAGLVAEAATGKSFETLIEEELAAPLGLERFGPCTSAIQSRSPAYTLIERDLRTFRLIDPHWYGGAGAACGAAGDLVRWWLALRSGKVVNGASLEAMLTPVELTRNGASARFGYGLGIRMGAFGGHAKIGHTGSDIGGTSVLAEYPDADLVIAVVTNTGGEEMTDAREIEARIAAALLGIERSGAKEPPMPESLKTAAPGLYRSIYVDQLCVTAKGDALRRSIDGEPPQIFRHLGGGRFGDQDEAAVEYFLGADGGKAEWFALDVHGFPEDLGLRTADSCG